MASPTSIRLARRFQAPPRFVTTPAYAAQTGDAWREAFPPGLVAPDRAVRYGRTADFLAQLDPVVPTVGVIESRGLYVAGEEGLVCSADGTILPDHGWFRGHADQMTVTTDLQKVERLPGTALALASHWTGGNFGHFIQDLVPRLAILERLGIDPAGFDHVICNLPNAFARSLLERLGVAPPKLVAARTGTAWKPDLLVAPTLPGTRRSMQPWAMDFFRRHFGEMVPQHRRIYLPRSSRKPTNDAALMDLLTTQGFEVIDPGASTEDQIRLFAGAEVVVGAHGAGLSGLVFCQPGTSVLEILSDDHVYPYYYSIAMAAGLRYGCMLGRSPVVRPPGSFGPSKHDFHVDEDVFAQAVADMLAERAAR